MFKVASRISSLLQKPAKTGTPPKERAPMVKVSAVMGITLLRPPMWRISVWSAPCITLPAPRNSNALEKPCAIRWNMAAATPKEPKDSIINPRWLMVE